MVDDSNTPGSTFRDQNLGCPTIWCKRRLPTLGPLVDTKSLLIDRKMDSTQENQPSSSARKDLPGRERPQAVVKSSPMDPMGPWARRGGQPHTRMGYLRLCGSAFQESALSFEQNLILVCLHKSTRFGMCS